MEKRWLNEMLTPEVLQVYHNSYKNGCLGIVKINMITDIQKQKLDNFVYVSLESMESCAIATLEKCNAMSDNQRPKNMIEVSV